MVLSFRCDIPPPPPPVAQFETKRLEITANITNITADGNVTITFSSALIIPKVNLTEFPSLNVTVEGREVPVLELSIKPGLDSNEKYLEFNWTMIEFNTTNLTLDLNFKYPKMVSYHKLRDYLTAKINGNDYFADKRGNSIARGYKLESREILP
jgi:hypothetical protein